MNSKQGINIIIGLLIIVFGYYAYILLGGKQGEINNISERVNLNETSMRMSEDYIPVKWEDKGKTIWYGLGFEPGFILDIKEGQEVEGSKHAPFNYPTKISFQENGEVEGWLNLVQNNNSLIKYEGNLMLGGDAAVSTTINITQKTCTKASGEKSLHSVNIKFGNDTYNGCIDLIKQYMLSGFYYEYAFFISCLIAGIFWFWIFYKRKDLRKEILLTSLFFLFMGFSEIFFKEYWNPKSLFGFIETYGFGIEDFLFCFFLGGIAASLWEYVFRKKEITIKHKLQNHHVFAVSSLTGTFITTSEYFLPNLTIYTFCIILLVAVFLQIYLFRKDLFFYVLESGVFFMLIYILAAKIIFEPVNYFSRFYYLHNLSGVNILNIPIEEYLLGFCFGVFGAFLYKFLYDKRIK